MTKSERSLAKLMAAASVLGLSLGMSAQAADTNQHKGEQGQTINQNKGETGEHKLDSGFLKHNTGNSNQIKLDPAVSNQDKHVAPSTELNPQPEPPKPQAGDQTPKH